MISQKEYEFLNEVIKNSLIDEELYWDEYVTLLKEKMIAPMCDNNGDCYGWEVTPMGMRAYEEYIAFEKNQRREDETLQTAKEANKIATQANSKSNISILIAIVSVGVAIISAVAAIITALK